MQLDRRGRGINLCRISQTLMTGDRTIKQMLETLRGMHAESLRDSLKLLHSHGLAYRKAFLRERQVLEDGSLTRGPYPVLWAWNATPHQYRDFEGPK